MTPPSQRGTIFRFFAPHNASLPRTISTTVTPSYMPPTTSSSLNQAMAGCRGLTILLRNSRIASMRKCSRCQINRASPGQRWCRKCARTYQKQRSDARRRGEVALRPTVEKRCRCCHKLLPAVAFSKNMARPDGLESSCRMCGFVPAADRKWQMPILRLSTGDRGYIAGLIDGEGSIRIRLSSGRYSNLEMTVTNTHKATLDWLAATVGGRVHLHHAGDGRTKTCWRWKTASLRARAVLKAISPRLRIKHRHAEIIRAFYQLIPTYKLTHPGGLRLPLAPPLSTLFAELQHLNRRGS